MTEEKGFNPDRVESILKRLRACHSAKPQMSLEAFFGKPQKINQGKEDPKNLKRKTSVPKSSQKKSKK